MPWTMSPDLVNAGFEAVGGLALSRNLAAILRHRSVRGVSIAPTVFFTAWGFWNLYFYPAVGQWSSFFAGLLPAIINVAWLFLALRYRRN